MEIKTNTQFEEICKATVWEYTLNHLDKSEEPPEFEVYIVWVCKALQNFKAMVSTTLPDGMYYEVTYNGDKKEVYLDAYKRIENRCIAV